MSAPIKIVYSILSSANAVTNIVGNRLNPVRIPQESAFPAISYNVVSIVANPTNSGHSRTEFARVQVNVYATSFADVVELASQVRVTMDNAATPETYNSSYVQRIEYDGENQTADDQAAFAGLYQISQDYLINYIYSPPVVDEFLLLESGDFMLLETGDRIIK
ncbi:DUF3168 domain-containing protein [Runella sp.]|uniref:tail completion protein gp17 n=1 Tax=Runella sp. TaxID=1960881 RepID=UPI003019C5EA